MQHSSEGVRRAGELESGNAGEPARLIRQRYCEAADTIKKGKMCSLFINDLDAGAGRMGSMTQYTVNNQMVNATLMNIADNPTNVQLPGVYKKTAIPRVPIICTGALLCTAVRGGARDDALVVAGARSRAVTADDVFVLPDALAHALAVRCMPCHGLRRLFPRARAARRGAGTFSRRDSNRAAFFHGP